MLAESERQILERLGRQEMSAAQVLRAAAGQMARGTLYVTLQRLVAKHYISSRYLAGSPSARWPQRPVYRATQTGESALAAWHAAQTMSLGVTSFDGAARARMDLPSFCPECGGHLTPVHGEYVDQHGQRQAVMHPTVVRCTACRLIVPMHAE